jgi:4-oxalomesaconate tautomerase
MAAPDGIRCMLMRGGTSKGAYFVADDVPADPIERDELMLRVMGSPDPAQIDGLGGAHPLTSKVAIVSASAEPGVDLDYLFLQVAVDRPVVTDAQTCGNLLAGVGPFALERGIIPAAGDETPVRIRMLNTGDLATTVIRTPGGVVEYDGDQAIDGVPGIACAIELEVGGGTPILPTGRLVDDVEGHAVTLIDNGMPVVLLRADEFGVAGDESPEELEADAALAAAVERVRRAAGPLMGLGAVADQSVPKMILVSPPRDGGAISTRSFIPARVHPAIGVLMAASVAAAALIPGTIADGLVVTPDDGALLVEHPSGAFPARVSVVHRDGGWFGTSVSERTARKIFDGVVYPRPRR